MRRLLLYVLVVPGLLFALSGITLGASKSVVILQGAEPTALNPVFERGGIPTYGIAINIFDALVRRTPEGQYVPGLAESYVLNPDGSWLFRLRRNVKFHNGEPFNAEAVRFTISEIFNPSVQSRRVRDLRWIKSVEVIDEYTVLIKADPYPLAEHYLSELSIVPPGLVQAIGHEGFARRPVGTGPFIFVRWTPGYEIVLRRNNEYYLGPSDVEEVVFRFVPSPASRVAALEAGEADLIIDPPIAAAQRLQANPRTRLAVATGTRVIFVGLDTMQDSPLRDVRVRQALNYAVDVDAIVQTLLFGWAERTVTLLTSADFGFTDIVKPYPYDPKKAKELLREAGYPNGFTITLDTVSGRYINDIEVVQAIAAYLQDVGVTVNIRVLEFGVFNEYLFSQKTSPMYFVGWGNTIFDAAYVFDFIVKTGGLLRTISDPEVDRLLSRAAETMDRSVRAALFADVVKRVHELAPCIFLYKQPVLYGLSARLDWAPRSDEFTWMYTAKLRN